MEWHIIETLEEGASEDEIAKTPVGDVEFQGNLI